MILEMGHEEGRSLEEQEKIDQKADTFRISLICTILESTREYMVRKKLKYKMERFLIFFQKFIHSKTYIPTLLEFMILDVFDILAPKMILYKTFNDSIEACKKILKYVFIPLISSKYYFFRRSKTRARPKSLYQQFLSKRKSKLRILH